MAATPSGSSGAVHWDRAAHRALSPPHPRVLEQGVTAARCSWTWLCLYLPAALCRQQCCAKVSGLKFVKEYFFVHPNNSDLPIWLNLLLENERTTLISLSIQVTNNVIIYYSPSSTCYLQRSFSIQWSQSH